MLTMKVVATAFGPITEKSVFLKVLYGASTAHFYEAVLLTVLSIIAPKVSTQSPFLPPRLTCLYDVLFGHFVTKKHNL